jgi:HSP20 family molecular chaperone IbpA
MSNQHNRSPRINIEETIQHVNTIGNQMLGTFCQIATPIVNEVCNNISNIQTNMGNLNQEAFIQIKPQSSLYSDKDKTKIVVYLPGVEKTNIDVKLVESQLFVSATTNLKDQDEWSHVKETNYKTCFSFQSRLKQDDIIVKYHPGLLKIIVNKSSSETTNIEIQ